MPIRFCSPDSFDDRYQAHRACTVLLHSDANRSIHRVRAEDAPHHSISRLEISTFSSQYAARSGPELGDFPHCERLTQKERAAEVISIVAIERRAATSAARRKLLSHNR